MTEEKRPTLSLKKKPAEQSTGTEPESPRIVRRKQVVNVTTPPAWKVKKEKLARKAEQIASAKPVPPEPASPEKTNRKIRYLRLPALQVAIDPLQPWWPALFDGDKPRLLATGMREQLFADIVNRDLPLSHKQVIKCLKSLTRSAGYLSRMKVGASRYDLQGNAVATVTAEEAQYASERMMKELLRAERKMSQTL